MPRRKTRKNHKGGNTDTVVRQGVGDLGAAGNSVMKGVGLTFDNSREAFGAFSRALENKREKLKQEQSGADNFLSRNIGGGKKRKSRKKKRKSRKKKRRRKSRRKSRRKRRRK